MKISLSDSPKGKKAANSNTPGAPDFRPADLALLGAPHGIDPLLTRAALSLVQLATEGDDGSGARFHFHTFSQTATEIHAALRLCRAALDFLDSELAICETEQIEFLRDEAAKFEALRDGEAPCSA